MIERLEIEKIVEYFRGLMSRTQKFTELDFIKLCKRLYDCMWMCDRMRVQQQLADTLADLVSVLQTENTIIFFQAFWTTLSKQWPTLDHHRFTSKVFKLTGLLRLDKFYLLARRYVNAAFKF